MDEAFGFLVQHEIRVASVRAELGSNPGVVGMKAGGSAPVALNGVCEHLVLCLVDNQIRSGVGVGTCQQSPVERARQMDPESTTTRHRVDQRVLGSRRVDSEVVAAKRMNAPTACVDIDSRHGCDGICRQTCRVDHHACRQRLGCGGYAPERALTLHIHDGLTQREQRTFIGCSASNAFHKRMCVDHATFGNANCGGAVEQGFLALQLGTVPAIDVEAFGFRLLREHFQRFRFRVVRSNDELASVAVRNLMLFTPRVESFSSLDARVGLEGPDRAVNSGVDDAAIAAGRFGSSPTMPFDCQHAGASTRHRMGTRESNNSCADHDGVDIHGRSLSAVVDFEGVRAYPRGMSVFRQDVLKDKVAFVTGGGSGICRGITQMLMAHGARAVITSRKQERLDEASAALSSETGSECLGVACDVRKPETVEAAMDQALERFGGIDIVVNGAAGNFLAPAATLSYNAFRTVIEIDTIGTYNVSKAAFDKHLKKNGGSIINISATLHYGATPLQTHASAAKAAVDSVTRSLALEWGRMGIRVNGIAPGPIADTEGMSRLAPPGDAKEKMMKTIPIGRWGRIDEIASVALFLSTDAASLIHGETIVADGGAWLGGSAMLLMG